MTLLKIEIIFPYLQVDVEKKPKNRTEPLNWTEQKKNWTITNNYETELNGSKQFAN